MRALADYAIFPLFVFGSMFLAHALQALGVPDLLVTPAVVGPFIAVAAILERVRPERGRSIPRDLSLPLEAAHFVFNFELGYGLALIVIALLEQSVRRVVPAVWPTTWPVAAQLVLLLFFYEGSSYWQHRLVHRRESLWPFHVLHHSGNRLDLIRAARFHFVDFGTAAFTAYVPLVLLGASGHVITLMAVLVSVLGLVQHGDIRARTPAWLDWLVCTPAVHRRHHSRTLRESNANFGNTLMIFDHLFGTWSRPHPVGPARIGLESDPLPPGFRAQFLAPFRGKFFSVRFLRSGGPR